MMDKTVEKVAESILRACCDYWGDQYPERGASDTERILAKAAIEALGVIILPEDAEPEVGDVVRAVMHVKDSAGFLERFDRWGRVTQDNERISDTRKQWKLIEIIQRNGKPVIIDRGD